MLIVFGVGQIIKNAYITRADDKRGQRKATTGNRDRKGIRENAALA